MRWMHASPVGGMSRPARAGWFATRSGVSPVGDLPANLAPVEVDGRHAAPRRLRQGQAAHVEVAQAAVPHPRTSRSP